ncbi:LOW QUALITY PROTEIN: dentin sialophosphoprotein-like [Penaeus monodon]|uniref:LOW QUALITY PROTEIN: dentin sialophosphoprotein-like n=1 Tax=Penaeus monodon TaxID=6687 RepID=UPI0018A6E3EC|nr:LOW QUALITY PROTEIN: dentin sialophosphoprotein-like [Penaeus monodon]
MTSRRKNKKNSNEAAEVKDTKKRGGGEEADGVVALETGRGSRRRGRTATPPSPSKTPDSPPRKTRRGVSSPSTPKRASPRGRGVGRGSPATKESPVKASPRGRGQRIRRGSTDSSASSVGAASIASSSTPTRRRGRRGSNSSEASGASETPQKTPNSPPNRRRKRGKSDSPPAVLAKKTNGASPQASPKRSSKRKRGTQESDASPSANGQGSHRTRRGGTSEDQDGGTEDPEEHLLSSMGNGSPASTNDLCEEVKDSNTPSIVSEEAGEDRTQSPVENNSSEDREALNEHIEEEHSNQSNELPTQKDNDLTSTDQGHENAVNSMSAVESEEKPDSKQNQAKISDTSKDVESKLSQNGKEEKAELEKSEDTCDSSEVLQSNNDAKSDIHQSLNKGKSELLENNEDDVKLQPVDKSNKEETSCSDCTSSSSSVSRVKRKMSDEEGDAPCSGSPETLPTSHKKHKVESVTPSVTKFPQTAHSPESGSTEVPSVTTHSKETEVTKQPEGANKQDSSATENPKSVCTQGRCSGDKSQEDRLKSSPEDSSREVEEVVMDTLTVADTFLEGLNLTNDQQKEILSFIAQDIKDSSVVQVIETLVEQLVGGACTVATMNAPRFNKFLQQLLAHYCSLPCNVDRKHALCEQAVQWARDRKSVHLRHELELTLMTLYYSTKQYKKAEAIANALYSETKKLQDKDKTVKACLCLSQVYHAMGNISKARANITTAKTEALKIYTPPDMQGELDLQSGIMQVAEGKDMETAYSYFKEAATGFTSRKQRARALKYMLLSKVMVNRSEEGEKAVRGQSHIQDIDEGVEAMLAITAAANRSSLADFKKTREQYGEHLEGDMVVASVLDDLYTKMMEKNLLNIVLPYERLQIVHIAQKIGLPREDVEKRLSQMILDKRINAQLDHRDDCLYVYGAEEKDDVYQTAIDTLCQLDKTVSHLNSKVKKLL